MGDEVDNRSKADEPHAQLYESDHESQGQGELDIVAASRCCVLTESGIHDNGGGQEEPKSAAIIAGTIPA